LIRGAGCRRGRTVYGGRLVVGSAVAVVVDPVADLGLGLNSADACALAVDALPAATPARWRVVSAQTIELSARVPVVGHERQAAGAGLKRIVDDSIAVVVEAVTRLLRRTRAASANRASPGQVAAPAAFTTLSNAQRVSGELRRCHGPASLPEREVLVDLAVAVVVAPVAAFDSAVG
jgi:hypothetical protein